MARGPLAGAAGPGKFSKRTDLPSEYYGEGVDTAAIKSGASLASTRGVADNVGGRPAGAPAVSAPVTELFAPTARPDEPITAGIDRGAGPGSEALGLNQIRSSEKLSDTLAKMIPYDTDGSIFVLYQEALARGN
jgi:hypothetical protein